MKLLLVLLISLSGCVTLQDHNQLANQILKPRKGFSGLTNRVCLKQKFGECLEEHIQTYDLSNQEFRTMVNHLNFICDIAGRRFKICMDRAGFCRITSVKKCKWFSCKTTYEVEEFIPVDANITEMDIKCYRVGLIPKV